MAEQRLILYPDLSQVIVDRDGERDVPKTAETMDDVNAYNLLHFSFPNNLAYKRIISAKLYLYGPNNKNIDVWILKNEFSSSVTYVSKPNTYRKKFYTSAPSGYGERSLYPLSLSQPSQDYGTIQDALRYGLQIHSLGAISTSLTTNPAYIELYYDDGADLLPSLYGSPGQNAFAPKHLDTLFRWSIASPGNIFGTYIASDYTFYWRNDDSETFASVSMGTGTSYTVPAETFTTDAVYWYVRATLNTGGEVETNRYRLTTVDSLYTCEILSPQNEIVDGSQSIPVQFCINNSTGQTPQSLRFDFNSTEGWRGWTIPGTRWADWSTSGVVRTWNMPVSNYMPVGEMQIRLYVLNSDGAAGQAAYSTVTRIAAPDAPAVSVDAVPRAVIRWQASGQIAYRVTLDGVIYGPYFGTTNAFVSPEILSDGQHTAAVEVQGEYGLWSQPGSFTFAVENQSPAVTLQLTGSFGIDAYLTMTPSWTGPYSFWIYRDGKRIGKTGETSFADRLALGRHEYQVLAVYSSGYYAASNVVSGVTTCPTMAITPADEESMWLELRTSASSDRRESYSYSKTHSLRHFLGAEYPVLEESSFSDLSGSFEAAFMDAQEAERFWALRGRVVILKARGEVMVGLLAYVTRTKMRFLQTFTFELQQIDWEGLTE